MLLVYHVLNVFLKYSFNNIGWAAANISIGRRAMEILPKNIYLFKIICQIVCHPRMETELLCMLRNNGIKSVMLLKQIVFVFFHVFISIKDKHWYFSKYMAKVWSLHGPFPKDKHRMAKKFVARTFSLFSMAVPPLVIHNKSNKVYHLYQENGWPNNNGYTG